MRIEGLELCPLCGHAMDDSDRLLTAGKASRTFFRCPGCKSLFVDPEQRPSADRERRRYLMHKNGPLDSRNSGYGAYLEKFLQCFVYPFAAPDANVLDYGCGPDTPLSDIIEGRGRKVTRWDPFFRPDVPYREKRYEIIVLHEVLEHCFKPREALEECRSLLAPGGMLCLSTLFLPDEDEDFPAWWYAQDITHVSFFTEDGLGSVLRAMGGQCMASDGRAGNSWRFE